MDNSNSNNSNNNSLVPNPKPVLIAKDWLTIAILTIIMALTWIVFGVYQTLTKSTVPEPVKTQALPLQSQLDEKVIDELQGRISLKNETLSENDRTIFKNPGNNTP